MTMAMATVVLRVFLSSKPQPISWFSSASVSGQVPWPAPGSRRMRLEMVTLHEHEGSPSPGEYHNSGAGHGMWRKENSKTWALLSTKGNSKNNNNFPHMFLSKIDFFPKPIFAKKNFSQNRFSPRSAFPSQFFSQISFSQICFSQLGFSKAFFPKTDFPNRFLPKSV